MEFENLIVRPISETKSLGKNNRVLYDNRCYTKANSDIEKIINEFYSIEGKQPSIECLNNLTPLAVAIWYQDDGSTSFYHRMAAPPASICSFCTDSFSLEVCKNLVKTVFEKFNINLTIRRRKKEQFRLYSAGYSDSDKIIELIRPYILPMFYYKIDYKANILWKTQSADLRSIVDIYEKEPLQQAISRVREEKTKW